MKVDGDDKTQGSVTPLRVNQLALNPEAQS
jgi:hypothetical protein